MAHRYVAVTIVSKAYLSLARVTARSFCEHHPDIPFIVLLTDEIEGLFDPEKEPYSLLLVQNLGLEQFERFRFQYSQQEFSYAVTPHVIDYLLQQGYQGVFFLKQETLVLDTLAPLLEQIEEHPLMLTPHFLVPPQRNNVVRRELDVLRAGVYNGGVILVANRPSSRRFLSWWQERNFADCQCRVEEGFHYEQRWLDFAPALVPGTKIIRDPGVNVGHWNLAERDIQITEGNITVNGEPCRIFRFSGYDPKHSERITKYYPDRQISETQESSVIFSRYHHMLIEEGYMETSRWPYAFGRYDNGVDVSEKDRSKYRQLGDQAIKFGDPLLTAGAGSFWKWLAGDR
jgi:hypothetical protein